MLLLFPQPVVKFANCHLTFDVKLLTATRPDTVHPSLVLQSTGFPVPKLIIDVHKNPKTNLRLLIGPT